MYMTLTATVCLPLPSQGSPVLLPGKCWAFHGVQGTLVISLSHPITITHVTLDHLPRYNSPTGRIDSAPKDFEVYVSDPSIEMMLLFKKSIGWVECLACLSALEHYKKKKKILSIHKPS